jgi:hypothetical protein
MAGTAFERSRVPLLSWFYAVYLAVHWRRPVPARTLARRLGVSYPTALRMAREIARHLDAGGAAAPAAQPAPWPSAAPRTDRPAPSAAPHRQSPPAAPAAAPRRG